jgi:hypothetical protein
LQHHSKKLQAFPECHLREWQLMCNHALRWLQGVLAGTSALISNTVFGFANASAKMLSSARQSLLVAGLDQPQPQAPPGRRCLFLVAAVMSKATAFTDHLLASATAHHRHST